MYSALARISLAESLAALTAGASFFVAYPESKIMTRPPAIASTTSDTVMILPSGLQSFNQAPKRTLPPVSITREANPALLQHSEKSWAEYIAAWLTLLGSIDAPAI